MNIVFKYIKTVLIATGLLIFTGCNDNLVDTEQFQGDIHLNVFGPCPVARGGELQFIGSGLDKINSIEIPNCTPITDIQRISEKEIRIVVPQTAEVGYVTLNYSGGQIKTKTPITYSEPVSIESISPNQVRPGEKIEIKGDYLNLMSQVCFNFIEGGDSVNVRHDEFLTHDRKTITVIVPEEAVSGFITLTDASAVQQRIKSPNELTVTLPSVDKVLELNDVTPGTNLTIKGRDLDLVKRVVMPNDNNVDFSYDASGSSISFSLPSDISEGKIYVVPASGVKVEVAKVTVAMPSDLTISPEKDVKANDVITISGKYVNQIVSVTIPNVDTPVDINIVSDSEINFIFPAMGQSGKIGLNLPSGKIIESRLTTAKPEAYSFNPMSVATGGEFTIIGKNLDLVNTLTFINDITITVEAESSTSLTVVVPAQAQSGPLTLTMANGESVRTLPLTVKSPECCYISSLVTETLIAGELMEAKVVNGDKLTDVLIDENPCQYIINGSRLFINIPTSANGDCTFKLVSSNGVMEYEYYVVNSKHQEIALLDSPFDLGTWSDFFRVYKESFDGVKPGAKLIFYLDSYAYTQIQINDANWKQLTILQAEQGTKKMEFLLTKEILDSILAADDGWSTTALCIQGEGAIITRANIEFDL